MTTEYDNSNVPENLKHIPVSIGNCPTHGEYQSRVIGLNGKPRAGRCPTCLAEIRAKEENRKRREQEGAARQRIQRAIINADIPPRFQGRDFAGYVVETPGQRKALLIASSYADKFPQRLDVGGGLVFCGTPGTGKTHLACAIASAALAQGYTALYRTAMDVIRRVRETYRPDSEHTERELLENYRRPDLMIIDEVGVQYGTEAEKMTLFEVINGRYADLRPTILVGNLPKAEMELYLGERIIERLQENGGAIIPCDWPSFRKRVKSATGNGSAK